MMNTTDPSRAQYLKEGRAARLRAVRFLAEHALAAGDAYAFRVGPDGRVSIQGERGELRRLVQLLAARPVESEGPSMNEWEADVAFDGGLVRVELTEML